MKTKEEVLKIVAYAAQLAYQTGTTAYVFYSPTKVKFMACTEKCPEESNNEQWQYCCKVQVSK